MINADTSKLHLSRRTFIKGMAFVSIGFPLFYQWGAEIVSPSQDLPSSLRRHPQINAWLEVLEDGTIRIMTGKMELGQGISTAILQVAAEELNTSPEKLQLLLAETDHTPNEGYTAGSRSIETSAMSVRFAAAAARIKLLQLAAQKLNVMESDLVFEEGVIREKAGNRQLNLAQLLEGRQIKDEVKAPFSLKPKNNYQWVGKPVKNPALKSMVTGQYQFVHDLKFQGMLYGQVIRPAGYDSHLERIDPDKISALPGVRKLVRNGNFIGVIADSTYQAMTAAEKAKELITWSKPASLPESTNLKKHLLNLPVDNQQVSSNGSISDPHDFSYKATYSKPYIMHGASGPSCAVALYENNKLHIWSHSQGVYPLRESLAKMLRMDTDRIHIKGVPGSGCYGHNGADDVAADAAIMAMAIPGRHVQVQWTRQQEHQWEPYGSAMVMQLQANLDTQGTIRDWKYDLWSDSHSTRPGGDPASLLAARHLEVSHQMNSEGFRGGAYRNGEPYYSIPNSSVDAHFFKGPLRISALRSLGAYANIFAIESFMEELAEHAGQDPLTFRIAHAEDPRVIEVLKKLQSVMKSEKPGQDEGIGYGFSRYKNSATYCAVAVKVKITEGEKRFQVPMMWAVVDAGEVINPDGLKNQIEGGMAQSASWTLSEGVKFGAEGIQSIDWTTYPTAGIEYFRRIEIHLIDRPEEPPLGAGEASQGPTAAAIANAIYKATGERVRDLPVIS